MDKIIQNNAVRMLIKHPDREFTILELSRESNTPYATCWRRVQELEKLGVLITRKIGNCTVCKLNKSSPYLKTIKTILNETPHRLAFNIFKNKTKQNKNVKKIYLFGSVAQSNEKPESDVDVAVIVERNFKEFENKINKLITNILKKTQIKIIPLLFTDKSIPKHFKKEIEKGELHYERT